MRLRGAKTEMKKAGESTDGMAESVSKLREQFKALSGVDIMKNGGKSFKSTYEILDELSKVWGDLSDIAKANVTELAAGKNRGNLFSSLMGTDGSGFEVARRTLKEAETSSGAAERELGKASDSIAFKVRQLKGTLEELSTEFITSDTAKGFLDTVNGIASAIDNVTGHVGGLKTALLGIVGVWTTISTLRTNSSWLKTDQNLGTQFKSIGSSIKNAGLNLTSGMSARASQGYTYKQYVGSDIYAQQTAQRNALTAYAKEYQRTGDMAGSMQKLQGMPNIVKQYAAQMDNLGESSQHNVTVMNQFNDSLKQSGVAMIANGKSLSSMTNTVKAFNSGAINAQQISAVNAQWGKYFSGLQQGEASIAGMVTKLGLLKVASAAASVAVATLNTAFSMGITLIASFAVGKIIEGIDSVVHAAENAREKAQDSLTDITNENQNTTQAIIDYDSLKKQYDNGEVTKSQLEAGTKTYLISLGMEESQVQALTEKYGSLSKAMKDYNKWKDDNTFENNLNDANTAVEDAEDALKKTAKKQHKELYDKTGAYGIFSKDELKSLGLNAERSNVGPGSFTDFSIDKKNLKSSQSIYKTYEKLLKERNKLIDKYSISDLTGKDKNTNQGLKYSVLNSLIGSESDENSLAYLIKQLQDAQNEKYTAAAVKAFRGKSFKTQDEFNKFVTDQIASNKDLQDSLDGTSKAATSAMLDVARLNSDWKDFADGFNEKQKEVQESQQAGLAKIVDFDTVSIPQSAINSYNAYADAVAKSGENSKQAKAAYADLIDEANSMGVTVGALCDGISQLDDAWSSERNIVSDIGKQYEGIAGKVAQKQFDSWYDALSSGDQLKVGQIYDNAIKANLDTSTWGWQDYQRQLDAIKQGGKDLGTTFTEANDVLTTFFNNSKDADGKEIESEYSKNIAGLITNVQTLDSAIDNIGSGNADPLQIATYLEQFPAAALATGNLADSLEAIKSQNADAALDKIDDKIKELQTSSPAAAEGLKKIRDELEKGLTGDYLDIKDLNTDFTNAYSALKSSGQSTGMYDESIYNLKKVFKDFGGASGNWDALFDATTTGVHVNIDAFNQWISKWGEVKRQAAADNLASLEQQYDALTQKINSCTNASEKAKLEQEQWNLSSQIQDAATLCSQLDGLTGAYNRWKLAQEAGNQGDALSSFGSKYNEVKELYDEQRTNSNEFRSYVDVLMYGDQTNATQEEIVKGWEDYNKNNGALRDFMNDMNGDNAVKALERLKEVSDSLGESWVSKDADGNWKVQIDDADAMAKALGVDVQYVNLFAEALDEFFEVDTFGEYDNAFSKFNKQQSEALTTLQGMTGEGQKLAGMADELNSIQFNSGNEATINSSYTAAEDVLSKFRNADGTVDLKVEGAAEAEAIFQQLYIEKAQLSQPVVMTVDASQLEGDDQKAVESVQSIYSGLTQVKADLAGGLTLDDSQLQTDVQNVQSSIEQLDGLDVSQDFKDKFKNLFDFSGTDTGALTDAVSTAENAIKELTGKNEKIKFDADTSKIDKQKFDKNGQVHYNADTSGLPTSYSPALNRYATLQYNVQMPESPSLPSFSESGGSAAEYVSRVKNAGKSKAYGGGFKSSGTALGGELGVELVAGKDGNARLVGTRGAELFKYKPGDIVFTHEQTEDILKRGWTEGQGVVVGKSYAEGYYGGGKFLGGSGKSSKATKAEAKATKDTSKAANTVSDAANDASSAVQETTTQVKDWVEVLISEIERKITNIEKMAQDATAQYSTRIQDYYDEIKLLQKQYSTQKSAADIYLNKANSIAIDPAYRNKIYNGELSIEEFQSTSSSSSGSSSSSTTSSSGEKSLYDTIGDIETWYGKYEQALDKQLDLQKDIIEAYENIFDLTKQFYDDQISYYEAINNDFTTQIEDSYQNGLRSAGLYRQQSKELWQQFQSLLLVGEIEEGSEEYYKLLGDVNEAKKNEYDAVKESTEALTDYYDTITSFESNKHNDYNTSLEDSYAVSMNNAAEYGQEAKVLYQALEALSHEQEIIGGTKEYYEMWNKIYDAQKNELDAIKEGVDTLSRSYTEAVTEFTNAHTSYNTPMQNTPWVSDVSANIYGQNYQKLYQDLNTFLQEGKITYGSSEYYDLSNKVDEARKNELDSLKEGAEAVKNYFDKVIGDFEDTHNKFNTEIVNEYGNDLTIADYYGQQYTKMSERFDQLVKNNDIIEGSEEYYNLLSEVNDAKQNELNAIKDSTDALKNYYDTLVSSYNDERNDYNTKIDDKYENSLVNAGYYEQQYDALSKELTNLVKNGKIKKGSEEYYNLLSEVNAAKKNELDAIKESIEAIKDFYDTIISAYQDEHTGYNTRLSEVSGNDLHIADLYSEQYDLLLDEFNSRINDGSIKKGSEEYYSLLKQVNDAKENELDTIKESIDAISDYHDALIAELDASDKRIESHFTAESLQGNFTLPEEYSKIMLNAQQRALEYGKEFEELTDRMASFLASGELIEGSEEYYNLLNKVNAAKQNEIDATNDIQKAANDAREALESIADYHVEQIENTRSHLMTYNDLFQSTDMYYGDKDRSVVTGIEDNSGQLKPTGESSLLTLLTARGIDIKEMKQLYDNIQQESENLYNEDGSRNKDVADRLQNYISQQETVLKNIQSEKEAIIDLVKNGMELELDALQKRIDLYEQNLDEQKSLYEYSKKIKELTSNISETQKIMTAYEGDTSQETMVKRQQLGEQLSEQQEDLTDTEYDQYITDQKDMLSTLYSEYSDILYSRLDNENQLILDLTAMVDTKFTEITDNLPTQLSEFGDSYLVIPEEITSAFGEEGSISALSLAMETASTTLDSIDGLVNSILSTVSANTQATESQNTEPSQDNNPPASTVSKKSTTAKTTKKNNSKAKAKKSTAKTTAKKKSQAKKPTKNKATKKKTTKQNHWGDVNLDGKVDAKDAAIILKDWANVLLGKPSALTSVVNITDTNNDHRLDSTDAAAILQHYARELLNGGAISSSLYNAIDYDDLAQQLGLKNSSEANNFMTRYLADLGVLVSGYASGTNHVPKTGYAWTQEGKKPEYIVRKSDGAVLTPLHTGDMVLNNKDTNTLWNFVGDPQKFINENLQGNSATVIPATNVNSSNVNNIQMSVNLPNVSDYNGFVNSLKNDKKFESMIQGMTVGKLNGGSGFNRNKYNW